MNNSNQNDKCQKMQLRGKHISLIYDKCVCDYMNFNLGPCSERPCRESTQGACWEASGHCNAKNVVYGAKVTYEDQQGRRVDFKGKSKRTYAGCTTDLKRRVAEHRTSFNPSTRAFTFCDRSTPPDPLSDKSHVHSHWYCHLLCNHSL